MIKKLFELFDGPGDALEEMKQLQMTNNSNIDKHVAKFKMLVTRSGLSDSMAVMDFFRETLPTLLQKQVMTCENPPATLKEWYEKAVVYTPPPIPTGFRKFRNFWWDSGQIPEIPVRLMYERVDISVRSDVD